MVSVSIVGVVQITIIKAAWSVVRSQHGATWIMTVEWLHADSYAKLLTL